MARLTFKDSDGEEISAWYAAFMVLVVLPTNIFILGFLSMLLAGVLHTGLPQFPALGYWSAVSVVALFRVLGWKGPITAKAPKRHLTPGPYQESSDEEFEFIDGEN